MKAEKNGWSRIRLKYLACINDEALSEETEPEFEIQYLDIGNVHAGGTIDEPSVLLFKDAPSRARRIVRDGDIIVSTVRTYLKAIAAIESPADNLIVSTGFAVLRPNPEVLNVRFCKYCVYAAPFIAEVEKNSVGVSYPAINASDLGNIFIDVPSTSIQARIAAYLDKETSRIDALIQAKERLLALLAEKRQALITQAVTRGINADAPLKDSGIDWLGKVPKHWKVKRLKFALDSIEQGWSPLCDNFPADENEWGVLKAGCVNGREFDPNENKRLPANLEPLPEYEVKPGDVLMSRANTRELLGSASLVRKVRSKLIICDKLYRLHVNETSLLKEYLLLFLACPLGRYEFERDATGASNSMQNIGQDSVKNVWLTFPPKEEQETIVQYVKNETQRLDRIKEANLRSVALLKERRAALITAVVTGEFVLRSKEKACDDILG